MLDQYYKQLTTFALWELLAIKRHQVMPSAVLLPLNVEGYVIATILKRPGHFLNCIPAQVVAGIER
jgi:hypothetical protein